jgi:[NiFe] hydrogenase assembly HybE family chaperone
MHPRIDELVKRFTQIGEENIKDLPIYNTDLSVEAIGFEILEGIDFIGILITPWFINLMLLPCEFKTWRPTQIGHEKIERKLPSNTYTFTLGGDEIIGEYYSISLVSPVHCFGNQEQARAAALEHLQKYLMPPSNKEEESPKANEPDLNRRKLLRGLFGGTTEC